MQNLHHRFVLSTNGQIKSGDFAKFCGLLRINELYKLFSRHSWYIAIAHIHFFGRPAKLGILILLAELRLHDLYVDGVMGGGLNIQLG